ncbi:MAG: DNA recombination protein RmuC, partial [Alphaproteobacteria bacterium]
TLNYVLMFVPNEQVYAFLHEHDRQLLDDAMQQKVILCSPMTLYAILAVIRQAVDNFHMERTAGEILELLNTFYGQWDKFKEVMEKMGRSIEATQKDYQLLTTTRTTMLEKPLRKIEELQQDERFTATGSPLRLINTDTLDKSA